MNMKETRSKKFLKWMLGTRRLLDLKVRSFKVLLTKHATEVGYG